MHKVIFACVHNSGRSQIAAAFFNQLADRQKAEAVSAGTDPGLRVHPEVLAVMQEVGIDLSEARPQKLTEELARSCSSRWVAETNAPMFQGCAGMIGLYPILKAVLWMKFVSYETTSVAGSQHS
jgi:hypothetical protein